ncbi:MAG: hypothetical protein LBD07_06675 [Spirochaetaceae bacterium]|jgi:hypothetical protein|nr:hypothetical protein [Spirochaetaceae bacterium]
MKKLILSFLLLFIGGSFVFSQNNPTIDDVFKVLDGNFDKFSWVHVLLAEKTDDNRPTFVKMNRLPYDVVVVEDTGEEKSLQGEVIYIEIRKSGFRYNLKLDFSPKKEKGAERATTVKNRLYGKLLAEILPAKAAAQ